MPTNPPGRPPVVMCGDAQAEALAAILRGVGAPIDREVVYCRSLDGLSSDAKRDCEMLLLQKDSRSAVRIAEFPKRPQIITFPALSFELLWPLNCVNLYDTAELPDYPHGRFPYGDSFVVSCIKRNLPAEELAEFCLSTAWAESWPNLDMLFRRESARLTSLDAQSDIKIGSYILREFTRRRLFINVNGPSDELLTAIALQIISKVMPSLSSEEARVQVNLTLNQSRSRDMLASIEVPIHPSVASHFGLVWYKTDTNYNYFDQTKLTYEEYYRRMIEHSYNVRDLARPESVSRSAEPTMIIYGNCQANALSDVLKRDRDLTRHLRIIYVANFDDPTGSADPFSPEDVANCTVLWEQHGPEAFPHRHLLPRECRIVKFPSVDFNALWPFNRVNPYVRALPPKYPFGRFPYGDQVMQECIEKGMSAEAIVAHYQHGWDEYKIDLDRLLQIEEARLRERESNCDVRIANYILENFRSQRLFWTVNHPTADLVRQLLERLIEMSCAAVPDLRNIRASSILSKHFGPIGPLGVASIPIHPKVAEHYGLTWYDAAKETFQTWGGQTYTYEEYFSAMITDSVEARRGLGVT